MIRHFHTSPIDAERAGIRVQTLIVAAYSWGMFPAQIAAEFEITESQLGEALAFCDAHRQEIDAVIATEHRLEFKAHG